jgi:hypothetical protein
MKKIIFEVTDRLGHKFKIYDDGTTEGFGGDCIIVNHHQMIIDQYEAKLKLAKAN